MKNRLLIFDGLGEDGNDEIIVPWYEIMRYHGKRGGDGAYIEFKPTAFFKDLALCSQIVHGAYGSIEVTTQLRGKYTIAIYWFLESKKKYKKYPDAKPGIFDMSIEEMRHQFCIPEKYRGNDLKARVLDPARESINNTSECDFTFEYESKIKSGKIVAFRFFIIEKNHVKNINSSSVIEENSILSEISSVLKITGLDFNDNDVFRIYKCAMRNNKTAKDIMIVAVAFVSRYNNDELEPVEDKVSYFCKMIEDGISLDAALPKKKDAFHNFKERTYDYDDLEKKLRKN